MLPLDLPPKQRSYSTYITQDVWWKSRMSSVRSIYVLCPNGIINQFYAMINSTLGPQK